MTINWIVILEKAESKKCSINATSYIITAAPKISPSDLTPTLHTRSTTIYSWWWDLLYIKHTWGHIANTVLDGKHYFVLAAQTSAYLYLYNTPNTNIHHNFLTVYFVVAQTFIQPVDGVNDFKFIRAGSQFNTTTL